MYVLRSVDGRWKKRSWTTCDSGGFTALQKQIGLRMQCDSKVSLHGNRPNGFDEKVFFSISNDMQRSRVRCIMNGAVRCRKGNDVYLEFCERNDVIAVTGLRIAGGSPSTSNTSECEPCDAREVQQRIQIVGLSSVSCVSKWQRTMCPLHNSANLISVIATEHENRDNDVLNKFRHE